MTRHGGSRVPFPKNVQSSQGASFSSSSSNPATGSAGVLEYCAKSELHLATARLEVLKGRQI
jgi:hypothetical protein